MPEIIVMLTNNDVTVPDAREIFRNAQDLPINVWGFKDVGLSPAQMTELVADMKEAGKSVALEVVTFDEAELLASAQLAVDCEVDYFTGARFSEPARDLVKAAGIAYFPFCGDVAGSPIVLNGTEDQIVDDARKALHAGADGVDLVAYRYLQGDPEQLGDRVVEELGASKVIIAGSINSPDRMRRMNRMGAFAYTMGGALFEGAFRPDGSFRDNLEAVLDIKAAIEREASGELGPHGASTPTRHATAVEA